MMNNKKIENRSTDEIIEDMQQQAKNNGLTEEILQEIVNDKIISQKRVNGDRHSS